MATLYATEKHGKSLEVRSAGHTRRLYVDGVLHTQYNPRLPLTGSVWDYLALSGLFAPRGDIQRVLLLGLGGGAVVHLLHRYVQPAHIVAVELDAEKISIARRFFNIDRSTAHIVHADAETWVTSYNGPPFDLIIDDLFSENAGEPVRAIPLGSRWVNALLRILNRPGWLTVNTASRESLVQSPLVQKQRLRNRLRAAFYFEDDFTENAIGCFCGHPTTSQALRQRIRETPGLTTQRARGQMHFRVHTLWR